MKSIVDAEHQQEAAAASVAVVAAIAVVAAVAIRVIGNVGGDWICPRCNLSDRRRDCYSMTKSRGTFSLFFIPLSPILAPISMICLTDGAARVLP